MRLIIPYTLDTLNGLELRYAIRSMVKHFKPLSGVVVVGDKPDWYIGEYIAYPTQGAKEKNIYEKLMQVQGTVLYSNDDYFALQDFDETLPNYYNGNCQRRPGDRVYRELYSNCPSEWLNFDVHCPMIIDTTKYPEWVIDRPIKTFYGNWNKLEGSETTDCKIRGDADYGEVMERIKGREFFSTLMNYEREGIIKVFQELCPEKSYCEG
jgi:hypothetical protein